MDVSHMEWRKAKKFSEVGKWEEIYLIKPFLFSFLSFKHFILQKVTIFDHSSLEHMVSVSALKNFYCLDHDTH